MKFQLLFSQFWGVRAGATGSHIMFDELDQEPYRDPAIATILFFNVNTC
jgi:hypothetical protein